MNLDDAFFRLLVALLCGGLIGFERQWRQKMAGLRTNVLVSIGASAFVMFAYRLTPMGDATRMAGQVVTGIGFLGAGVIMHEGITVHGLNTAATLWCSAAVGMFAGGGMMVESVVFAVFVTVTNLIMRPLVGVINRYTGPGWEVEQRYVIKVVAAKADEARLRAGLIDALGQGHLGLQQVKSTALDTGEIEIAATVIAPHREDAKMEAIVSRASLEPSVSAAKWQVAPNDRGLSD
ncbi:membrane protein [Aliidongia dinghuensis]|uniref:Protein MgtC n=1 Tax=Aliidongia dinghuensis TaxID=1867774 RepID=A0A8J2YSS7_9PROT|nr:MgtC/SapB family protein [Aliidongia dinghuensis]GGF15896.1 membrane protein [Aliidongia dinghuensis]